VVVGSSTAVVVGVDATVAVVLTVVVLVMATGAAVVAGVVVVATADVGSVTTAAELGSAPLPQALTVNASDSTMEMNDPDQRTLILSHARAPIARATQAGISPCTHTGVPIGIRS
jgi:hypothetical protein